MQRVYSPGSSGGAENIKKILKEPILHQTSFLFFAFSEERVSGFESVFVEHVAFSTQLL
jgi:hypothetical protein